MKTSKQPKRKLLTLAGVVFAVFVLKALVDGSAGTGSSESAGTGIDLPSVLNGLGSFTETVVLWVVVIPGALYLLYLAVMKVAPAPMRKDHSELASKRMRKWAIIGALVLVLVAYALHYVPILAREAAAWAGETTSGTASGIDSAAHAFGDNWVPIVWFTLFAVVLSLGYWWSTKSETKLEQIARFGMVGIPVVLVSLVLGSVGVIGS